MPLSGLTAPGFPMPNGVIFVFNGLMQVVAVRFNDNCWPPLFIKLILITHQHQFS